MNDDPFARVNHQNQDQLWESLATTQGRCEQGASKDGDCPGTRPAVIDLKPGRDYRVIHGAHYQEPEDSAVPASEDGNGRVRRVRRASTGYAGGVISELEKFFRDYVVLPQNSALVVSAWVAAAWLADLWDRFPHLAVTSPEKRCGKTRLLQLLELITPAPVNTASISPAAVYRLVEQRRPTLLIDEGQSIARQTSGSSQFMRDLLCAGIDRDAKVLRAGKAKHDYIEEFHVYGPKVIALIGDLDGVLADRCLPICLRRKIQADKVLPYRSRLVKPKGQQMSGQLQMWANEYAERVATVYDNLEVLQIRNDRLAEMLLPLQAVLQVSDQSRLVELEEYARALDTKDVESESPGVRLLAACRDIFAEVAPDAKSVRFLPTIELINRLAGRSEEPWAHLTRGGHITAEALANLLRPFGIRSQRNARQTARGYVAQDFEEAWARYLSAPEQPSYPG